MIDDLMGGCYYHVNLLQSTMSTLPVREISLMGLMLHKLFYTNIRHKTRDIFPIYGNLYTIFKKNQRQ